jgi:hypothetical protein
MDKAPVVGDCPFLHPGLPSPPDVRIAIYCRLPDRRVRVPSDGDKRRYCLTGRWPECPVYLDHAAAS